MEKRSRRRIRNLVALAAFKGLSENEIGCARISMMAGSDAAPSKGRIQKRKTNPLQIVKSSLQRTAGPYKSAITGPFACSLNYLIGNRDEPRRYGKPQLLGCLEVDGQLEFGHLVDRDVTGLCSSENCVDVIGDVLIQFRSKE